MARTGASDHAINARETKRHRCRTNKRKGRQRRPLLRSFLSLQGYNRHDLPGIGVDNNELVADHDIFIAFVARHVAVKIARNCIDTIVARHEAADHDRPCHPRDAAEVMTMTAIIIADSRALLVVEMRAAMIAGIMSALTTFVRAGLAISRTRAIDVSCTLARFGLLVAKIPPFDVTPVLAGPVAIHATTIVHTMTTLRIRPVLPRPLMSTWR